MAARPAARGPAVLSPRDVVGPAAAAAAALAVGAFVVYVLRRVEPVDFLAYRYAVSAAWHGFPLYTGNVDGPLMPSGGLPFTYPPFALVPLAVTTLLPSWTAYLLWSAASMLLLAWVLSRFVPLGTRYRPLVLVVAVVVSAFTCIVNEHIAFGQIGIALMALVIADLVRSDTSRLARALPRGVLVGLAAAIKLTPGLFLVHFLLTRQWRLLLWSTVAALGASTLAAVLFPGLTGDFLAEGVGGLTSRVALGSLFGTPGNNSVQGALGGLLGWTGPVTVLAALVVGAGGLLVARHCHRAGREVDAWLAIGITAPMVSPISWVHHWVFLLPALLSLLLRTPSVRSAAAVLVATIALLVGPDVGDELMGSGHVLLAVLGVPLRECLLLVGLACLVALYRSSVDVGPSVLRRPASDGNGSAADDLDLRAPVAHTRRSVTP